MMASRLAFVAFLLTILSSRRVLTCTDVGQNVCKAGTKSCTTNSGRVTFSNGEVMGVQSTAYSISDLTQGCYCQYAQAKVYETDSYFTPYNNNALVTKCSPSLDTWYDGAAAMNTTGGTFGMMDRSSIPLTYDVMKCSKQLQYGDAPSNTANLYYVDWPTASQANPEVSLPSNVQTYTDGQCNGYDVQPDYPNNKVSSVITQSNVVNCTCQTTVYTASIGWSNSNDYPSFNTVCDRTLGSYYNGKGYRSVRTQIPLDLDSKQVLSDKCSAGVSTASSTTDLVFVSKNSGNANNNGNNNGNSNGNSNGTNYSDSASRFAPLAAWSLALSSVASMVCLLL